MKTIFISSTYEDLKNHRRKVWDLLEGYEVSIRGMEQFGARTETPLNTCLAEVEQCDIFVGVIGYKLGSIDKSTGKSFVQREYERAYELKKEIFIYFTDDKNTKVSLSDIDFDEKREKLKAFKSILKERHTIDFFMDEKELTDKLKRKFDEVLVNKKDGKDNVSLEDEYIESKETIDKFLIIPKTLSGRIVRLEVSLGKEPFPVSKAVCENFNLEYGGTIGAYISIIKPDIETNFVDYLLIDGENIEKYFSFKKDEKKEIYAAIEWTSENIKRVKANFIREIYYEGGIAFTTGTLALGGLNNIYGEKKIREPEGAIMLLLDSFIE